MKLQTTLTAALLMITSIAAHAAISEDAAIKIGSAQIKNLPSYANCTLSGEGRGIYQVSCNYARELNADFREECRADVVVSAADGKVLIGHPGFYPTVIKPNAELNCNSVLNTDGSNNGYGQ